ncbi:MAG TPA: DUF6755 family protein [Terriglobales bacterium]|nr:DUF6755 family protein [Terriglobales bacterium]
MADAREPGRSKGLTAIDGAMALIVVLLLLQIWLLTTTLENFLAGYKETTLPAAIVSGLIFAACIGLYFFINGADVERRKH